MSCGKGVGWEDSQFAPEIRQMLRSMKECEHDLAVWKRSPVRGGKHLVIIGCGKCRLLVNAIFDGPAAEEQRQEVG